MILINTELFILFILSLLHEIYILQYRGITQMLKGQISDLENAVDSKHIHTHTHTLTSWVASHKKSI